MNSRWIPALACAAVLSLTTGCGVSALAFSLGGLQGSGHKASEPRTVGSFSKLEIAGSVDADVSIGSPQSVVVEGDDNLLTNVLTSVKGETLVISAEHGYSSRIGVKVRVVVPNLEALAIDGSGDVQLEGLKAASFTTRIAGSGDVNVRGTADNLDISVHGSGDVSFADLGAKQVSVGIKGSGDVRLRGSADQLSIAVQGSGNVNCADLKARQVKVETHGSGDAQVFASESLDARIDGSGDITYAGSPANLKKTVNGSGDIISR